LRAQRDLALGLLAAPSPEEALKLCLETAILISGLDFGAIYLVDQTTGDIDLTHAVGLSQGFLDVVSHLPAGSDRARLVMAGRPVYDRRLWDEMPVEPVRLREGLRAIAVLPIAHRDRVIACLSIASHTLDEVPSASRDALETIAAQVGAAIARFQAEEAVRAGQLQLQTLVDTVLDFVFVLDTEGRILHANRVLAERLGYTQGEMVGRSGLDFVVPHERARDERALRDAVAGDEGLFATFLTPKDGSQIAVEMTVALGRWGDRDAVFGVARDVTARWRAQETQRALMRGLRSVIEAADELIGCPDMDGLLRRAVELGREKVGFERCSIFLIDDRGTHGTYGTDCRRCTTDERHLGFPPEHGSRAQEILEATQGRSRWLVVEGPLRDCVAGGVAEVGHGWTAVTAIGSADRAFGVLYNDTAITHSPLNENQQEIGAVYCSLLGTLVERKRAEEALRRSEERFRAAAEMATELIFEWEPGTELIEWSDCLDELLGYPPGGFPRTFDAWLAAVHPGDRDHARQVVLQGLEVAQPIGDECRMLRRDGSVRHWAVRARPVRDETGILRKWFGVVTDITARKEAEEERRRLEARILSAQKLESLSVLAGGVAHDFSNLLVGVLGNVSLVQPHVAPDSPAQVHIEQIHSAALRAAELAGQMLAYAGKGAFVVEPLDLSRLVDEMADLLACSISKKAVLKRVLDDRLPLVQGDATQLRQLIMNLVVNASDALGDRDGGITVATGQTEADRDTLAGTQVDDGLPAGRYVYLEVSDTGCGMDEDTRARIFDPFFTTKAVGRGLGLAAGLGIVRGHRGAIAVESQPGSGATFRVLFPALEATLLQRPPVPVAAARPEARAPGGTVLVADDEAIVRSVARMALEEHGFKVLVARDGQQAVEMFRENADDIVAVLLDLTMPKASGAEVLSQIRHLKPDTRVILSSGYSEQYAVSRLDEKGPTDFIQKPYDPQHLVRLVCRAAEG
jgi:PAS domain S-box-containing protein